MQSSPTNHETTKPSRKHAQASNARQFIRNANDDAVCSGVLPGDFGEHPNPDFPPAIKELASISHIALDNIKDILNSVISWLFITSYFAFLVLLLFQAFDFRNWHTIQQTFGLVDPLTNTSLIFAAPRTSGPYLLHDFDALHKIQRSATQALLDGREVASRFVLENDSDIFNTVRRLDLTMNAIVSRSWYFVLDPHFLQFVVHAMLHTPFPQDLIRLEAFSQLMANVLRGLEGAQETHLVQNKMGERFHVTTIADSKGLSQFSKMWAELQVEHRNAVALGRKLSDPTARRPEVGSRHVNRDLVDNYMRLIDSTSSNSTGVSWFRDTVIQSAVFLILG